jgi:hypothetical protein
VIPWAVMAYRAELTDVAAGGAAELMQLWRDNLHVRGEVDAKRRWAYLDAPSGPSEAMVVRADDGTAVGCAGIERRELWCRGVPLRAALLADFAIDRRHRIGFPAVLLQRAVQRHVESRFDLSYGFPNASAVAIHLRTGYHELGKMARYVRPLRFARYLERRYGHPRLAGAAARALDPAARAVSWVVAARASRRHELTWLTDVDPRFDALWARAAPSLPIVARRDAALLRWRFLRTLGQRSTIAALTARTTGDLVAYAIIRDGEAAADGLAEIVDLFGATPAALEALLDSITPALARRGYEAISVRFLGSPTIEGLLLRHGFQRRGADRSIIVRPTASCAIAAEVIRDRRAWYLTDFDEDT